MSGHILDLTKYAFARNLGDITVYGTWVGPSVDESEPCLVLVPTHRIGNCRPVVIGLSAAYKYDDPRYLLQAAIQYNRDLGFEDSASNVHKVASVIYDHLQDLIELPPRPVENVRVGAEAIITEESGRTHRAEILDYD